MKKSTINPWSLFNSQTYGFSQIVVTDPGKLVFISGQVAWDEEQNIIGENDLAKQAQQSIDNINKALAAVGGTLENVVMLRIYLVKHKHEDSAKITQVLKHNFGRTEPPATTWLSVDGLANEAFMVEIEAQAVI